MAPLGWIEEWDVRRFSNPADVAGEFSIFSTLLPSLFLRTLGSSALGSFFSLPTLFLPLSLLSLFFVYHHISSPRFSFSESHGGSRLLSQPAPPRSLPFSHPFRLYTLSPSRVRSLFRVYPSIRPSRHPPGPFSLFLRFSLFLSLASSPSWGYTGVNRGCGWVGSRLGWASAQ